MVSSAPGDRFLDQRRRLVRASGELWGLEWVEVLRLDESTWSLVVHFIDDDTGRRQMPPTIAPSQVRILLGDRPQAGLSVQSVEFDRSPETGETRLVIGVRWRVPDRDLPAHRTLELADAGWLDRFLSSVPVIFADALEAGATAPGPAPPPAPAPSGTTDYRVKDYDRFRRLLLDRMTVQVPEWRERNPSDLGVEIIELLAYAADRLSYYQDAVAGEAYMETARRRVSVRRHARMLDFRLHEGLESRVWLAFSRAGDDSPRLVVPAGTQVANLGTPDSPDNTNIVRSADLRQRQITLQRPLIFHTLEPVEVRSEHARLRIYCWGTNDWTLRAGTMSTHLEGHLEHLQKGDVLLFAAFDADRRLDEERSQVVRLCDSPSLVDDPARGVPTTEIFWHPDDALRHDLPVGAADGPRMQVFGNVVPADHGPIAMERLEPVTEGDYRPTLDRRRIAHCQPFDAYRSREQPAVAAAEMDPSHGVPMLRVFIFEAGDPRVEERLDRWLREIVDVGHSGDTLDEATALDDHPAPTGSQGANLERRLGDADLETWRRLLRRAALASVEVTEWSCRADLLNSGPVSQDFVLEVEPGDRSILRFGDGHFGRRPPVGAQALAIYRRGRGSDGNVGSNSLDHLVLDDAEIATLGGAGLRVLNPLRSFGGSSTQRTEKARLFAPTAFRDQRRCVVIDDYVVTARRHPEVADAAARWIWAGAGRVARIHVSRQNNLAVDDAFRARLEGWFEPFLLVGRRIEIEPPIRVPIEIGLRVTLEPGHDVDVFRYLIEHPEREAGRQLAELFTPGRFRFGEDVYLSEVIAAVAAMPGVARVQVDRFRRSGDPGARDRTDVGQLAIAPCEIAHLGRSTDSADGIFRIDIERGDSS
ncbi:MAG: hypothetical protein AAGE94_01765 [Acidobacteriota bacterium]